MGSKERIFSTLDLLIYLFTYLFVWFNLPRKYLVKIDLCNEKTLLSIIFFQNIPIKMEEPSCIAKGDWALDFAKWTWRISSDGIKGGEVCLKLGANYGYPHWPYRIPSQPPEMMMMMMMMMMMSCNSLVVMIGLNTFLETWRGNGWRCDLHQRRISHRSNPWISVSETTSGAAPGMSGTTRIFTSV